MKLNISNDPIMEFFQIEKLIKENIDNSIINLSVNGCIGSGKTTFIGIIYDKLNNQYFCDTKIHCHVISENIDKNNELFIKYCENRKKYCYQFQKWIVEDKLKQYNDIVISEGLNIIIWDSSIMSDHMIFCLKCYTDGFINVTDYNNYSKLIQKFPPYDIQIYLRPRLIACLNRIKKRARKGEEHYDDKYISDIYDRYEELFIDKQNIIKIKNEFTVKEIENEFNKLFINN